MTARYLIFEDGSIFAGEGLVHQLVTFGEVVFNTSMTGYQEIITNQVTITKLSFLPSQILGVTAFNVIFMNPLYRQLKELLFVPLLMLELMITDAN